jgi:hypothetical protein
VRFFGRMILMLTVMAGAIGPLAIPGQALAQQIADVIVTAGISSAMSLTFCDTTADFGNGLTALGATPTGTTDRINASKRGDRSLGQGTIYSWIPSCPAGQQSLEIESTVPWQVQSCATENTGSSSLSVEQGDLRYAATFNDQGIQSYASFDGWFKFDLCQSSQGGFGRSAGFYSFPIKYVLRVDVADAAGTFNSTTTWTTFA